MTDQEWEGALVRDLLAMADPNSPNRAALAHLRRGLDGPPDYTLARVGWLFQRVPDYALREAVLAASLFAWVKGECPHKEGVNFGAAFGEGLTIEEKQRREKRFVDLLETDAADLRYKLRQAITLIAPKKVGLDWARLIRHLRCWSYPSRKIQKDWARGFWSTQATAEPEPSISTSPATN